MTRPTLLVSGGSVIAPLLPALSVNYDLMFLYPPAAQQAADNGVQNVYIIGQYITSEVREQADNVTAQLTAQVVGGMPAIAERVATLYPGHVPPSLNGNMASWFGGYALTRIHPQIMELAALEKVVENVNVVGCVVHEDLTADLRSLVLFCNARNIPTIHIPHAACHLLPGVKDIHRETRAKYILASGRYMAEFYADSGHALDKIRIVGVPQWDNYSGAIWPTKEEARRVLGEKDKPLTGLVLTYGTTWAQTTSLRSRFDDELEEGLIRVIETAKIMGATLIIKMHPGEQPANEQYYADKMKAAGVYGMATRSHMVYTIRAADALIAQGPSNVCIEAAMMGTPSCYIQTEGFDYAHALPLRYGNDAKGLASVVIETVDNIPSWGDFIHYYNDSYSEGNGTERAVREIEALCRFQ